MPMLNLHGKIINVYKAPDFKDQKTGEVTPGRYKIQMQAENILKNGEKRVELVQLTTDRPDIYNGLENHLVSVPVGGFVNGRTIGFYLTADEPDDLGVDGV
jgi:hypothetical protein